MREVTSLINILFSFTSIVAFPFSAFGGFMKSFILSAYLIFLHLDALFGHEDYFCSCLSWWGFCHFQLVSLLLTRSLLPIFTMGCHKRWFLFLFISKLVNPFSSMCVWEWYVLHFVSHFIKTMLMSNAHPYLSLLKCFAMTHTHYFVWAYS